MSRAGRYWLYFFVLVCSEVWPVRQQPNAIKAGEPSWINERCRRDTVKKKVPDKVYRGGSGGGKKRCRKDKGGGTHTQSQKMLIKRWAGMKSCLKVPRRWQCGHAHTLKAQPIFLRRSAPNMEVGRTHFSHAVVSALLGGAAARGDSAVWANSSSSELYWRSSLEDPCSVP